MLTFGGEQMKRISILTVFLLACFLGITFGSSPELIRLKLEHAKEDLRVSLATEKKIESEFNQLKASGNTSPELLMYYETYLARVREMVEENRKLIQEMEAAYARYHSQSPRADNESSEANDQAEFDIPSIERVDEIGKLDKELNASLAAFDELLLIEIERIRARSSQKMRELAFEAADAAREARQSAMNTPENERKLQDEMNQGQQSQQGQQQGQQGQSGQQSRQGQQGKPGQKGQDGNFSEEGKIGKEGWEGLRNEDKQQEQQGKQGKEGNQGKEDKQGQPGQNDRLSGQQSDPERQDGKFQGKQGNNKGEKKGDKQGKQGDNKKGNQQGTIPGQEGGERQAQGNPYSSETGAGQIGTVNHEASQATAQGNQSGSVQGDNTPPQYEDDDIVARQLREAAENETDPELKEKLWKEYHEYKQGS